MKRPPLQAVRWSVPLALVALGFSLPAGAGQEGTSQEVARLTAPVEQVVRLAEAALEDHEDELAESYYHSALLEGWIRLGVVDLADGDLPAVREDLYQATRSAARGTRVAEDSFALVQLHTGETAEALAALRGLVARRPGDLRTRAHLVHALVLAGEVEEARREIEGLRAKEPEEAARLESSLAETEGDPEARRAAFLPTLSAGPTGKLPEADRLRLRSLFLATQGLVYRNLAVLQERAGRSRLAAEYAARADELDPPRRAEDGAEKAVLATIDLRRDAPIPAVEPLRPDETTVWKTAKVELLPALQAIQAGKPEEAEDFLRHVLEKGDDSPARDMLAILLAGRKRYDEAEKQLLAAIAAAGDSVVPMREHLARLYLMQSREAAAVEQLRAAARQGELERDLTWKLVEAELAAGHVASAKEQLRSLTRRFRSPRASLRLAELEEPKAAATLLREAQGLAPNSEEVLARTARACLKAGFAEWAAESAESLLRMHPAVAEYQRLLDEARARLRPQSAGKPASSR